MLKRKAGLWPAFCFARPNLRNMRNAGQAVGHFIRLTLEIAMEILYNLHDNGSRAKGFGKREYRK